MAKEERLESALRDLFAKMDDVDFINLHNDLARDEGYNMIYEMSDIDEVFNYQKNYSISDVLRDLAPDFDHDQEYFTIDDHDIIKSFDSILDPNCPADIDEMIRYIVDTGYGFGNDDIEELLDSFVYTV